MPRIVTEVPTQPVPVAQTPAPVAVVEQPTNGIVPSISIPVVTVQTLHGKKKRQVVYDQISVSGVIIPRANLKVTLAMAKDMLGWETEAEFQERMLKLGRITDKLQARFRNPSMEPTKIATATDAKNIPGVKVGDKINNPEWAAFAKTTEWSLLGPDGQPVVCWRNINNRPLDGGWVQQLAQDVVTKCYLLNGENIIIGKTRLVISGQHRMIALIWACWLWSKARATPEAERTPDQRKWLKVWPEEPYIESLVSYGIDEDQETLMSIDNTKARTDADNFYTSELVEEILTNLGTNRTSARKECSSMMQDAVKVIFQRTGAGNVAGYKTKQVTMQFAKTHRTILQCTQHIYSENSGAGGRPISDLGIKGGQAVAMMYLMGSCTTHGDAYRSKAERTEEGFDWGFMEKAKEFWSLLAASNPDVTGPMANPTAVAVMKPVRQALAGIIDPNEGGAGNEQHDERSAIIAKAWGIFKEDCDILKASLDLRYDIDREPDTGRVVKRKLLECPLFGSPSGVDLGKPVTKPKAATIAKTTKEEVEKLKAEARKQADAKLEAQLKSAAQNQRAQQTQGTRKARLDGLKAMQPGKLLLFATGKGSYSVYDTDAMLIAKACSLPTSTAQDGIVECLVPAEGLDESVRRIVAQHPNTVVVTKVTVPEGQNPYAFTPLPTGGGT